MFQLLSWCVTYRSLAKELPWAKHLMSLLVRGLGALSSVSAFHYDGAPMGAYSD